MPVFLLVRVWVPTMPFFHFFAARQENYYNDVPFGDMLFEGKAGDENSEDTGSLMDTTVNNAVAEFGFPVEFFLDMLCRCGGGEMEGN